LALWHARKGLALSDAEDGGGKLFPDGRVGTGRLKLDIAGQHRSSKAAGDGRNFSWGAIAQSEMKLALNSCGISAAHTNMQYLPQT